MNCTQKEIAELLPWFVNGTLPEVDREKVKSHLQSCEDCQAAVKEIKSFALQLQTQKENLLSEHILSAKLVQYAEARNELSPDDQKNIEAHLKTCSQCSQELATLEKVNASLMEKQRGLFYKEVKEKFENLFSNPIVKPTLAYIIILLLLYPAYLGIFKKRQVSEPIVAGQNYELLQFEDRAAGEGLNEISLDSDAKIFSLSFNVPVVVDENIRYQAEILDSNHNVIWEKAEIKSLDEYGTFLIFCDGRYFDEGFYELKISEINRTENRIQQTFTFPFKIVKTD